VEPSRIFTPLRIAGFAALALLTLLGFAAPFLPESIVHGLGPWLAAARAYPWAPVAAILGFALFASFGVPQIVLITALVAAFGPWAGLFYSWSGKMLACGIGFAFGRRFGARIIAEQTSERLHAFMRQLARHGFWASALIRLVPTVPSVLINIAAGATPITFRDFIAGTALGSVPKMALMAFGGHAALVAVQQNSWWAWVALAIIIALWALLAFVGRRWIKRMDGN
jgi:uncharacterized membrane protein YdjX (TVP38/TMEM64 family)